MVLNTKEAIIEMVVNGKEMRNGGGKWIFQNTIFYSWVMSSMGPYYWEESNINDIGGDWTHCSADIGRKVL